MDMASRKGRNTAKRSVTIRVKEESLRRVMKKRGISEVTKLFNELLEEEEERLRSQEVHREIYGRGRAKDIDDRLL